MEGGFNMNYGYIRVSTKAQLDNNSFDQQEKEILERYPSYADTTNTLKS